MKISRKGELNRERRGQALANRNERNQKNERRDSEKGYTAVYKVNRSDELMEFLLKKSNTSRNNVKSLLSGGLVAVNGSVVSQYNFALAKDDEVKILKTPNKPSRSAPDRNSRQKTPTRNLRNPLKILYEDDEFIAVDKPAGLLSVESDKETECAFGYVLAYLQSKNKTERPFILHRIDKETSGVLLFAKNLKIHSMLKMKWSELVKLREYYAVAEGKFENKKGTVVSYLKENKNNLMYVTADPNGQKAVTNYTVIKENEGFSLLCVSIETGRKNQIRVQLGSMGHSIVGDDKYGFTKNPIDRLGLHASKLEFEHPISGSLISIRSSIPPSFRGIFG